MLGRFLLLRISLCLILPALSVGAAAAQSGEPSLVVEGTFEPRFVALNRDRVPLYVGPRGESHVKLTYRRRGLPVVQVDEYEEESIGAWALIIDRDGDDGWVRRSHIDPDRRGFIVTHGDEDGTILRPQPNSEGGVAILLPGVVGRLTGCQASGWCEVAVSTDAEEEYRGWLPASHIWGSDRDVPTLSP